MMAAAHMLAENDPILDHATPDEDAGVMEKHNRFNPSANRIGNGALLRIVHLEDDLHDAELVQLTLDRAGMACEIVRVDTQETFVAALEARDVDLILADDAPTFDGATALKMARARWPRVPFLFVSDINGEEVAVERLKAGARDYVLKHRLAWLPSAMRRALREADERTKRECAERRVRALNAELEVAKEIAERANRAKSEFLSHVSHDLRTPLNAILGFAQLLEMDPFRLDQHDHVHQIVSAGRLLGNLIDELLDIAGIEMGRLVLAREPVVVSDLVHEALNLVRPLAARRDVALVDDSDMLPGACFIGDRRRLIQILLNLLTNGIKYNRVGGRVRVTCAEAAAPGRLRLNVIDTGPGLEPEQQLRLFQPFERLGAERSEIEGTGLGLALSKGLAEAMGGNLGVTSTPGQGSTFWIELARTSHRLPVAAREVVQAPNPEPVGVGGKVLYIEDNPANLRLMESVCQLRPQVSFVGAKQAGVGVELARTFNPNLIMLDLRLPDTSGEDVLRQLHDDERTRHIPVAIVSADATPAQKLRLRHAGAAAYLTKPMDIREILQLLDTVLGRASAPQVGARDDQDDGAHDGLSISDR